MGEIYDKIKKFFDKPEVRTQVLAVGPLDANEASNIGEEAFQVSDKTGLPGRHNGQRDAFRHAYLSCRMAQELGTDQAEKIGNIHEQYGENPPEEIVMDVNNNEVGRKLAVKGGESVDCKQSVWDALNKGELQTAPTPGAVAPKLNY
ncbi:MAG: hypothetical protein K1X66_05680 [Verrucomicrobiae bacterium]|nr:hypothetical protein [Verrucomicrobiae bacterium]